MASRPKGYGMTAELTDKKNAKYDEGLAGEAMSWIGAIVGDNFPETSREDVQERLKDGQVLCQLINALRPGSVRKVNNTKMAFKQMENINSFLSGIESYGVTKADSFQTVDLYEGQNMNQVINTIHALGRAAQRNGFSGPVLGPKESQANKREFTQEQLRAGDGIIGLQAGSNKGATQAGQNFGKGRMIVD